MGEAGSVNESFIYNKNVSVREEQKADDEIKKAHFNVFCTLFVLPHAHAQFSACKKNVSFGDGEK